MNRVGGCSCSAKNCDEIESAPSSLPIGGGQTQVTTLLYMHTSLSFTSCPDDSMRAESIDDVGHPSRTYTLSNIKL